MDMSAEEAGVLLTVSAPGSTLTIGDYEISSCLPASRFPGRRVASNPNGSWRFVYITDRRLSEVGYLASPWYCPSVEDPMNPGEPGCREKRRYRCQLDAVRDAACSTYRTFDEAPLEQIMSWDEFVSDFLVDKADG